MAGIPAEAVGKLPSAVLPSSLVTAAYVMYASLLGISEALHLDIFHQPHRNRFFDSLAIDHSGTRTCDKRVLSQAKGKSIYESDILEK